MPGAYLNGPFRLLRSAERPSYSGPAAETMAHGSGVVVVARGPGGEQDDRDEGGDPEPRDKEEGGGVPGGGYGHDDEHQEQDRAEGPAAATPVWDRRTASP